MCNIPAKYSFSLYRVKWSKERRCDIYEVAGRRRRGSAGSAALALQKLTAVLELDRGWISSSVPRVALPHPKASRASSFLCTWRGIYIRVQYVYVH